MGFVVSLLVPALKVSPIERVPGDVARRNIDTFADELSDELRNPLAFVHEEPNLSAAQTMGKPSIFAEDERARERVRANE